MVDLTIAFFQRNFASWERASRAACIGRDAVPYQGSEGETEAGAQVAEAVRRAQVAWQESARE